MGFSRLLRRVADSLEAVLAPVVWVTPAAVRAALRARAEEERRVVRATRAALRVRAEARPSESDFSDFVEHPRYGRGPRFTDVRPRRVPLGYHLTTYVSDNMIAGTAVEADLDRQASSPVPVLYYFDLKRKCVECGRPFIFFAEEQKYWYETLGFVLDANCIRCTDCRKRQHGLERQRRRYEDLFHREERTADETLEMAECALTLIESGVFHARQTERVRMLLNTISDHRASDERYDDICRRVLEIESARRGEQTDEREPE